MKKYLVILITIIIFVACGDKVTNKKEYYGNGKLKRISYFHSDSGIHPFRTIEYNKSGMPIDTSYFNKNGMKTNISYKKENGVEVWAKFKNGLRQGKSFTKLRDGTTRIDHYLNDTLFGVSYSYDAKGKLVKKAFWYNDTITMYEKIEYIPKGVTIHSQGIVDSELEKDDYHTQEPLIVYSSMTKNSKEGWNLDGVLFCDSTGKPIESRINSGIVVEMEDTICNGELLNVKIQGNVGGYNAHNVNWKCNIYSLVPEADSLLMIKSAAKPVGISEIIFKYKKYRIGYNFIWGTIEVDEKKTYSFFDDFFVKRITSN